MNLDVLEQEVAAKAISPDAAPALILDGEYSELVAVRLALQKMPPIKTVGTDWYQCVNGTWRPTTFHQFRPMVLSVLGGRNCTGRHVAEILKHIEGKTQVAEAELIGGYLAEDECVLLNAANGILRIGCDYHVELLPLDSRRNFTRQLEASYDENARCPAFMQVLRDALPDGEDQTLLQLFAGSILLPTCKFEAALVCYGPGGTGKSTIAEAIASVFGPSMVERIGIAGICDPKGYSLPKLKSVLLNLGTEMDAVEVEESSNYKALVSGESIDAREIYGRPVLLTSTAKLWFLSNNLPRFKHGSDAELRRTRLLRFEHLPAVKDVNLKAKLAEERDGIFHWIVQGASNLLSLGEIPRGGPNSRRALERFAITNDPLGAFIESRCILDSRVSVSKDRFRKALLDFCEEHDFPPSTDWLFKQLWSRYPALVDTQVSAGATRIRHIKGITLNS